MDSHKGMKKAGDVCRVIKILCSEFRKLLNTDGSLPSGKTIHQILNSLLDILYWKNAEEKGIDDPEIEEDEAEDDENTDSDNLNDNDDYDESSSSPNDLPANPQKKRKIIVPAIPRRPKPEWTPKGCVWFTFCFLAMPSPYLVNLEVIDFFQKFSKSSTSNPDKKKVNLSRRGKSNFMRIRNAYSSIPASCNVSSLLIFIHRQGERSKTSQFGVIGSVSQTRSHCRNKNREANPVLRKAYSKVQGPHFA